MRYRQNYFYLLVLCLLSIVVITAFGGGIFDQREPWQLQWQHQMFADLCHQSTERSFWINGQPMAVCSRCFGIYSGFTMGWLLLPLLSGWNNSTAGFIKKIVGLVILINLFDIIGNMFGFWENTLISRLILGYLTGNSVAFMFTGDFFNRTIKSMESYYGRFPTKRTS